MREVAFIKQNKEKWLEFERAIFNNDFHDSDDLAAKYIQIIDDLAFAQTFYPKSKSIDYLNQLAVKAYQIIYRNKREDKNRIISFWKTEVPLLLHENRKFIYVAFIIFFTFTLIGVISAANDGQFVRSILGDSYVDMTLENIENGDPVAVYKSGSNWGSFLGITINNIRVGIFAFLLGIFGGAGTLWILFKNCIMLGSFQYFFYEKDVFWESVRGIWIHGSMEIFAIVIEAAAGLILGASILFPGTYSRMSSFKNGVKTGVKILISTFPFTISAGFLEGFITRYSNVMPNTMAVLIILVTLSAIAYYYLLYPFKVVRKVIHQPLHLQH